MHGRKVGIGDPLLAVGVACKIHEIISALAEGSDVERLEALGAFPKKAAAHRYAYFHQRAAGEVDLVLERPEIEGLAAIDCSLDGIKKGEPVATIAGVIEQQ